MSKPAGCHIPVVAMDMLCNLASIVDVVDVVEVQSLVEVGQILAETSHPCLLWRHLCVFDTLTTPISTYKKYSLSLNSI